MLYLKSINLWRRWGGGVYFLEVVPNMQISISFQKYLSQRKIISKKNIESYILFLQIYIFLNSFKLSYKKGKIH